MKETPRENEATPPVAPHKLTKFDYLITFLLVNLSGNSALYVRYPDIIIVASLAFFLILLIARGQRLFTPWFMLISSSFVAILLIQSVMFSFFPIVTIIGFLVRLTIGYAAVRLVKDFPLCYVNVLFYTGLLSLCFYLPDQLGQILGFDVKAQFEPIRQLVGHEGVNRYHILIHNFQLNIHAARNSSYFGEPGLFASHLLLAFIFLSLVRDQFTPRAYKRRMVLLIICLLTTLSTTGYCVLLLAVLLHLRLKSATRSEHYRRLLYVSIVLLVLGFAAYKGSELKFITQKIKHQYELVLYRDGDWKNTRFGGIVSETEYVRQRPILGWGLHPKTRYYLDPELTERGLGGGSMGFVTNFGFVGMSLFMLSVFMSFRRLAKGRYMRSGYCVVLILLMGIGQPLYNFPLYMSLMFLGDAGLRRRLKNKTTDAIRAQQQTS
jgi:hypothetical protein